MSKLKDFDPEIFEAIKNETFKQQSKLQLIASENFVSETVLEAQGSVMTNKYAEGYPGHRYYAGCEYVDVAEDLARERAKKLFNAEYVNVQPHSGSQANMAVYFSVLQPGDTVLGMNLAHGGHLTHGSPVNFSGKLYKIVSYGVNQQTEMIDYDELEEIAKREKPKMIIAGASAYPRTLDFPRFRKIADSVGAYLLVDMAHIAGLVATGLHPSPVPYSQFVTSTTHKTLRGPRGGMIISTNEHQKMIDKNVFPGIQGGPLMHVIAAKAVAFKEALSPEFKTYQEQVLKNSKTLAAELIKLGFKIVSGGTDNHLMLVDLRNMKVTGKDANDALNTAGIVVNKNGVPFDTEKPMITSGIRIGTPSITTRGMKEADMILIASLIYKVVTNRTDTNILEKISKDVKELCDQYPLYPERLKELGYK